MSNPGGESRKKKYEQVEMQTVILVYQFSSHNIVWGKRHT